MNTSALRYGVEHGVSVTTARLIILERLGGCLLALLIVPISAPLLWLCVVSYLIRAWAMEGVNHRYFAHRAYAASRTVQFVLALIALQAGQRGPLWWAAKHRDHHKFADTDKDAHSPQAHSFMHAYYGFVYVEGFSSTDLDRIPDFACYPELRLLNRHYLLPLYGVGTLLFLAGHFGWLGAEVNGVGALLWGFSLPCFLSMNTTAMVNTLCHCPELPFGYRRYDTNDFSVNRPLVALVTLGAGWHNNHHRHAACTRAGFAWYEIDLTYYALRALGAIGVIRRLRNSVPRAVLEEGGLVKTSSTRV